MVDEVTDEELKAELYRSLKEKNCDRFLNLLEEAKKGKRNVDLNTSSSPDIPTLLQCACDLEVQQAVKILLKTIKPDVNQTSVKLANPPLILAIEKGNLGILKLLVHHLEGQSKRNEAINNALHLLISIIGTNNESKEIRRNYVNCLDLLLNSTLIDINAQNDEGCTPLHIAGRLGVVKAVEKLLEKGADPNLKDSKGCSVLHHIANATIPNVGTTETSARLLKCLRILLNWQPQFCAAGIQVDVNAVDASQETILHRLVAQMEQAIDTPEATNHYSKCLDLVLSSPSIQIDARDKSGDSALFTAACCGIELAVIKLLENEADPHLVNNEEETILHQIAKGFHPVLIESAEKEEDYMDCLNLLLKLGYKSKKEFGLKKPLESFRPIDVNLKDKYGNTPLLRAIRSGCDDVVKALLRHGAMLDKEACKTINPETLESLMDSSIYVPKSVDVLTARLPITLDYSILLASQFQPKSNMPEGSNNVSFRNDPKDATIVIIPKKRMNQDLLHSESEILLYLSRSPKHRHLLKHPLVETFVMLKWHSIRNSYWMTVSTYTFFLLFCTTYILLFHSGWDIVGLYELNIFVLTLDILFIIWEFSQFCITPLIYVRSFENWIDVTMLAFTFAILNTDDPVSVKHFSALAILLAWTEGLILLSRHPQLSMFVAMFTTVSITFFRLFMWFSTLLIGFSVSLFLIFGPSHPMPAFKVAINDSLTIGTNDSLTIQKEAEIKNDPTIGDPFDRLYDSLLKFGTMLTGEFDSGSLPFNNNPVTSRFIFTLFVFFVPVVLMNLLNGLAITDIQEVQNEAETYNYQSQVESFSTQEFTLLGDPSHRLRGWTPIRKIMARWMPITSSKLNTCGPIIQFIYKKTFLFYKCFPDKKITFNFHGHLKYTHAKHKRCNCHSKFQLDEDILRTAQQKALENKRNEQLSKNTSSSSNNKTDSETFAEKIKEEIQQILGEHKKRNSAKKQEEAKIISKLRTEIEDLKQQNLQILQLLQRLSAIPTPSNLSTDLDA